MMPDGTINITPDKSLIRKLGYAGYTTVQAVSELVDNSIDARIGDAVAIDVLLSHSELKIIVRDDGCGMDLGALKDALTLARGSPEGKGRLGKFGLGLKTACSALGPEFRITTSKKNEPRGFVASYDESEWEKSGELGWEHFPYSSFEKSDPRSHGTTVEVSRVKVPMYYGLNYAFRKHFGERYYEHLLSGAVKISLNGIKSAPAKPAIEPNSTSSFTVMSDDKEMRVEMSLLKKRSIAGNYGMDLYYRSRLIEAHTDFGMRRHPEVSKVTGKISLDHVPVNFTKTAFMRESIQYKAAEEAFKSDDMARAFISKQSARDLPSEAASMWEYFSGGPRPDKRLDSRTTSHSYARKILGELAPLEFESGGKTVRVKIVADSETYSFSSGDRATELLIGADSPVFKTSKNPMYLLSMMVSDAAAAAELGLDASKFFSARNSMWEGLLHAMLPVEARAKSRLLLPDGYGLSEHLTEIYGSIRAQAMKFQFSGLSTLQKYAHYVLKRPVYSLYVEKGNGQAAADIIHGTKMFKAVLNPKKSAIDDALGSTTDEKIVAVREYSKHEMTGLVAGPAKAWLDLYREVTLYGLRLPEDDLYGILEKLVKGRMVTRKKLESIARRRSILQDLARPFDEVFSAA